MKVSNTNPLHERPAPNRKPVVLPAAIVAALLALVAILAAATSTRAASGPSTKVTDSPGVGGSPSSPSDCGLFWRVVPTSNPSPSLNYFNGVEAISSNDIWAVGYYNETVGAQQLARATAQHWNGTTWTLVTVPQPGAQSFLYNVSAASPNDVWAVGDTYSASPTAVNTLVIHWDGSAWTQVSSPNPDPQASILLGIKALASDAAWAVGDAGHQSLVLFWDGTTWSIIPSPSPDSYNILESASATSVDDMWAVGYHYTSGVNFSDRTFAIHCSRSGCTAPTSPNPGVGDNDLLSVAALSTSDVWAVGYAETVTQTHTLGPLATHWDGLGWSTLPVAPIPAGTDNAYFQSVVAISSNNVWGLGVAYPQGNSLSQSYAVHWNGSAWTLVLSPNQGSLNGFSGGDAISSSDVWAVGFYTSGPNYLNLAEHYNDPCVTPSPTPTNIPNPSPSPTTPSCSIQFTDVPVGSTFYSYVHCLACQNILGGYSSGCASGNPCFKPGNPVTRGQLAKIVSNSAGYSEQHTNQSFEDVPVGSTFYLFVERLASRNIIGGYACGGLGEPCVPPANLPYFRPNAQVTRGQTSKIVAIAASLPAPPPGQQTFQDVPPSSTFWQWIEALSTAGTINGYPCGGAGEPCLPPQNRPYFRPGNNVTRGQAAKIVSNTFFPNCQSHLFK